MKKIVLLLTALSMLICLISCKKPANDDYVPPTNDATEGVDNFVGDGIIKFLSFNPYDGGDYGCITGKTLEYRPEAYALNAALHRANETDEEVAHIADTVLKEGDTGDFPRISRDLIWIESMGKLYRVYTDYSQICSIETHYGKGKVLEMTKELKQAIKDAWEYSPYYSYYGTYIAGDETVELEVTNESDAPIRMSIKDIKVQSSYHSQNTITIELTSSSDQDVMLYLQCEKSGDYLGAGDKKALQLKKDSTETVTLNFGGFPDYYWLYISAGYTRATIHITETNRDPDIIPTCITIENGTYYLNLSRSGQKINMEIPLTNFKNYASYITNTLVSYAEAKILNDISEYEEEPMFYLKERDGFLYLAAEVIENFDKPNEKGEDHAHHFFSERISKKSYLK